MVASLAAMGKVHTHDAETLLEPLLLKAEEPAMPHHASLTHVPEDAEHNVATGASGEPPSLVDRLLG